jgi:hypothetical protein
MSVFRQSRSARVLACVGLLLAIAGCSLDYDKIQISDRYPVGNSPSPECVKAAKEATHWCERGTPRSDPDAQSMCSKARWDHARAC